MIVTHKIYTKQKFWLFAAPLLLFYTAFIIYPLIMRIEEGNRVIGVEAISNTEE